MASLTHWREQNILFEMQFLQWETSGWSSCQTTLLPQCNDVVGDIVKQRIMRPKWAKCWKSWWQKGALHLVQIHLCVRSGITLATHHKMMLIKSCQMSMPPLKAVIVLILLLYSKAAKASCSNRFQSNFGDYSRGGFLHSTPQRVMESRVPLARNESQHQILKAQPPLSNLVSNVTHRCVSTTWSLLRRAIDAIASRLGVTPAVNFEIVVDDGKGCCYPSPPPQPYTHRDQKA